mmetsp:Transcript_43557/g.85478  ORF Transcript_43557/g.85478 Transcript_43557/m.85478 type:complete len:220 (+) Transcript_43557:414-1073(+)
MSISVTAWTTYKPLAAICSFFPHYINSAQTTTQLASSFPVTPHHRFPQSCLRSSTLLKVCQALHPCGRMIVRTPLVHLCIKPLHDLARLDLILAKLLHDDAVHVPPPTAGDVGLSGRETRAEVHAQPIDRHPLRFMNGDRPGEAEGDLPSFGRAASFKLLVEQLKSDHPHLAFPELNEREFFEIGCFCHIHFPLLFLEFLRTHPFDHSENFFCQIRFQT